MRKGLGYSVVLVALLGLSACGESEPVKEPNVAQTATAVKPQQYAGVAEMMEDRADFHEDNGTFKLISKEPLHIQLMAEFVPNDLMDVKETEVRRITLYGIYRTLIHTESPAVTVDVVSREITFNPPTSRPLEHPAMSFSVTREQALAAVQKVVGVESLDQLVTPNLALGIQLDEWSEAFKPYYHNAEQQQVLVDALRQP